MKTSNIMLVKHPLDAYLERKCANRAAVARVIGVSVQHFAAVCRGERALLPRHIDALVGIYGEEVREVAERHIEFCGGKRS